MNTQGPGQNDDHPAIETLEAYHQGALCPGEASRIWRHLVLCRDCSETLLDLVDLQDKSPEPSRLWSAEVAIAWEEWLTALKQREGAESPAR